MSAERGKLYLIGAGPGDPELLTLKAVRALRESDVILYDRLVAPEALQHARPDALTIYVGKHHGEQERTQAEISELIVTYASQGRTVARLKGGDPVVFGRGAEEWMLALEHGLEVEVVPGVTSAIAVPELAGIPVTFRRLSQSFVVIAGHEREGHLQDWRRFVSVDTLVILMGVKHRTMIASALIQAGRRAAEPAAFVERGATAEQKTIITTLAQIAAGTVEVTNPAVWVIGEVVRLRNSLSHASRHK